jgi:hypothetical protein
MPLRSPATDQSFAPIRVVLAVLVAFAALIVVLLIVRPNMMMGLLHEAMSMM